MSAKKTKKEEQKERFFIQTWTPVWATGEMPDDDDNEAWFDSLEEVHEEIEHNKSMQPENVYMPIRVRNNEPTKTTLAELPISGDEIKNNKGYNKLSYRQQEKK